MSTHRRRLAVLALPLLLAAAISAAPPAPHSEEPALVPRGDAVEAETKRLLAAGLERFVALNARLVRVLDALRLAGAPECSETPGAVPGWLVLARDELPAPLRPTAARVLDMGERPQVIRVDPDGAAFRAGVRAGDAVATWAGRAVRTGAEIDREVAGPGLASVAVQLQRAGVLRSVELAPPAGCGVAGELRIGDELNAASGEGRIVVTSALLRLLAGDDALAVILGHELAHAMLATASESEADALGLVLAARAGFDVAVAPEVWRRWTLQDPLLIHDARRAAHPSSPERALHLQAAVDAIRSGRAPGDAERGQLDAAARARARDAWLEEAAHAALADAGRVLRLGDRLRRAAAPLCGERVVPLIGLHASSRPLGGGAPPPLVELLLERFDVGRRPTVTLLDPTGPAARAGVRTGDRLLELGGRRLPDADALPHALSRAPDAPLQLVLERDGERHALSLEPVAACAPGVELVQSHALAAWVSTAGDVHVGRGLLAFAPSDDELAAAIAHALGHALLDATLPAGLERERKADRLALRMLGEAGFDPRALPALQERLAVARPALVEGDGSDTTGESTPTQGVHGHLAARLVAARAALRAGAASR